jgi:hypothetical protein
MDPNNVQIALLVVQILTLVAIIIYVWKTWAMADATRLAAQASEKALEEMRAAREEESRPFVLVFFRTGLDGTTLYFVIKNVGRLAAKNVRFTFEPALEQGSWNRIPIRESPRIKDGIPFLPPGEEYREFFDAFVNLEGQKVRPSFQVRITFQNPVTLRTYEEEQTLEWKSMTKKLGGGDQWYRLAEEIKKLLDGIAQHLEKR